MESKPACKNLVLDAGPLLSLSPLRGLAEHYLTVPQVLSELKDNNAREHFEKLGLLAGIKIEVREPDAASLSQVIQFAKKTGDYSVLSHADLCVLALTFALDTQENTNRAKEAENRVIDSGVDTNSPEVSKAHDGSQESALHKVVPESGHSEEHKDGMSGNSECDGLVGNPLEETTEEPPASSSEDEQSEDDVEREPLDVVLEHVSDSSHASPSDAISHRTVTCESRPFSHARLFDDPPDDDDGEGEWITPDNVEMFKSRALDLFPMADSSDHFVTVSGKKGRSKRRSKQQHIAKSCSDSEEQIAVGCMTTDFAMQNVLLQMNLNLVGVEGKRIDKVKTWVLRCHACFKICKDQSKKFCPSCGNPSLLRTSVTVKSPTSNDSSPPLEVHLKKNFVYRTRGTKYPIPAPKSGSSKTGSGEGLILREDQLEYTRARKREEVRRQQEERRIIQQSLAASAGSESTGIKLGNWMDPDWMPEMLSVGIGGKGRRVQDGRTPIGPDGMPIIGYGKRNPNERRHKR